MLIEFNVENHLSFKDSITLSMVASNEKKHPKNKIKLENTKYNLLKTAAIYGANASGKSNLIKSLLFMKWFVTKSSTKLQKNDKIPVRSYKLNDSCRSKPSFFEIVFLQNSIRYRYGFLLDVERVHEEWLYSYPIGQPRKLFERKKDKIKFGSHWKGGGKSLVSHTRPNALFLSVATQFNNELAGNVYNWFLEKLVRISDLPTRGKEQQNTLIAVFENDENKKTILRFLQEADLDIDDFQIDSIPLRDADEFKKIPEDAKERLLEKIPLDAQTLKVKFNRFGVDAQGNKKIITFDSIEESAGTNKFFALAYPLHNVLKSGCVAIIDELDVRLHPLLSKWIIKLFLGNDKNAQLIFTTHDTCLLDLSILRRDQFWFTEKIGGNTKLYSLWDYNPRKEENITKGYLAGRYGAIPIL